MAMRRYFIATLVIITLAAFIVPGVCTVNPGTCQGLNPGLYNIQQTGIILEQTATPGAYPDNSKEGYSNIFLSIIKALRNYSAAGTILIFLLTVGLLTSLLYNVRLKRAEVDLLKSFEEGKIYRNSISERLNDTFAVISSMILMQILNSGEEETKQKLAEINNRIISISLVHENLLESKTLSKVNLHEVFEKLGEQLVRVYTLGGDIVFKVNGKGFLLDIAQAVPLNIVMNEIISNSLKYAFVNRISGEISVEYKCSDGIFELCVRDDGVGIPENLLCESPESLGLNLIRNIVSLQLKGTADLSIESGTKWLIRFPVKFE